MNQLLPYGIQRLNRTHQEIEQVYSAALQHLCEKYLEKKAAICTQALKDGLAQQGITLSDSNLSTFRGLYVGSSAVAYFRANPAPFDSLNLPLYPPRSHPIPVGYMLPTPQSLRAHLSTSNTAEEVVKNLCSELTALIERFARNLPYMARHQGLVPPRTPR
jgi:hypothetical protein